MFTLLDSGPYVCGETPNWVEEEKAVYWVDAASHEVFKYELATKSTATYTPNVPVTAIRKEKNGRFYLLSKWGLYLWQPEPDDKKGTILAGSDYLNCNESLRFNDGVPLSNGTFIAGAFDEADLYNGNGGLYLLNLEGKCNQLDDGLHVPNGVTVTADERTVYLSEMYKNRILAYTVDDGNENYSYKNIHIIIPENQGKPDGLLCDSSDHLWVAHWRGWRLTRYDNNGVLNKTIKTPFATPTCPCFKGAVETEIFLTTATLELSPEEMKNSVTPGGMFSLEI